MKRFRAGLASVAVLLAGAWGSAAAQTYPSKPIHIVVPYIAGGAVDATARAFGSQVAESIGQQVVVENRPGGSAIIGIMACAKAPPDGYTVCLTVADSVSYNPYLIKDLPYEPATDLVPVIYLVRGNSMLFAKGNAPFNSFKEMIAYAKANPGALNWGTWGPASIPDVYLRWIKHQTGVNIAAVPYKGAGQAVPAVLAGEVDASFMAIGAVLPHIRSGKLKALAIVGDQRSPLLPGTPSLAEESADPGLRSYFGVFAPAKTPKSIVDRLNAEFTKALQSPRIQQFTRTQTLDPVGGSPEEFAKFLKQDRENSERVFRAIGVRASDAPS